MNVPLGLALSLVSAIAISWAYTWQHDAASGMEPLSLRRPLRAARLLLSHRGWLIGLGLETVGWLLYAAALRLAPLALVQGVTASGIAVLALITAHGRPSQLARREQLAVVASVLGLVLLSLSLVGVDVTDRTPNAIAAVVWLLACAGGATALWVVPMPVPRAAALGLASGVFFAAGDICLKLVVEGGWWIVAGVPMIAFYAVGTLCLQSAFQHGDALTGAGLATLATNALPIAAGFVLFGESLPGGIRSVAQLAGFVAIVGGAILLADKRQPSEVRQPAEAIP
jgi:hypothetical protein